MELTSILIIAVGILIFLIMILACVYLKILMSEKKRNKSNNDEAKDKVNSNVSNSAQMYNKQSIFSFMEFDKIEDNMIVQKNGNRYLMVIECQGINYDLMSKVEKTAVEDGFSQFLNTLRHPIQIYTQTRTINLDSSLQNYRQKVDNVKNSIDKKENQYKQMQQSGKYTQEELNKYRMNIEKEKNLYEYGKDIIFNTERMSLNKNVLRKQYYIVVSYYSSEAGNELFDKEEIRNLAFSELYTKCQSMIRTLSACSVIGKIMDSYELVDLLYNAYNRDQAEIYGMKKALQAGYNELYITAQDVLDKRMEALNQQIEEKGMEQAKNAIDEVKSEKQKQVEKKEKSLEDLIAEMAERILEENKKYIGEDITNRAKAKIRNTNKTKEKGENASVKEEKKSTRRTSKSA